MKYGLPKDVIEKVNCIFSRYKKVSSVILYGSRATETFRAGSDIDLALLGDNLSFQDALSLSVLLEELNLPYEVDLCILSQIANEDLVEHIQRVGRLFYHREV